MSVLNRELLTSPLPACGRIQVESHRRKCSYDLPLQAAVKLLLAHGAVMNAAASDNMNALHFAAMKGQTECITTLLAAGTSGRHDHAPTTPAEALHVG